MPPGYSASHQLHRPTSPWRQQSEHHYAQLPLKARLQNQPPAQVREWKPDKLFVDKLFKSTHTHVRNNKVDVPTFWSKSPKTIQKTHFGAAKRTPLGAAKRTPLVAAKRRPRGILLSSVQPHINNFPLNHKDIPPRDFPPAPSRRSYIKQA